MSKLPLLLDPAKVVRKTNFVSRAVAPFKEGSLKGTWPARKPPVFGPPFTQYRFDAAGHYIESMGCCVGCAGAGFLNATPFPAHKDQAYAEALWDWCRLHDGDRDNNDLNDPSQGTYPGTLVKRLKQLGLVEEKSGLADTECEAWEWSLSSPAALPARIVLFGSYWWSQMNFPEPSGRVKPKGDRVGGHEFIGYANATLNRWEFIQSWVGYGPFDDLNQRFWMIRKDVRKLVQWGAQMHLLSKKKQ